MESLFVSRSAASRLGGLSYATHSLASFARPVLTLAALSIAGFVDSRAPPPYKEAGYGGPSSQAGTPGPGWAADAGQGMGDVAPHIPPYDPRMGGDYPAPGQTTTVPQVMQVPSSRPDRERDPASQYTRTLVGPLSANAARLLDDKKVPGIFFTFQDLSVRTEGSSNTVYSMFTSSH